MDELKPIELKDILSLNDLFNTVLLLTFSNNVVVIFGAEWYSPYTNLKKDIYKEYTNHKVQFVFVDVNKNDDLMLEYKIKTIPHFIFLNVEKESNVLYKSDKLNKVQLFSAINNIFK